MIGLLHGLGAADVKGRATRHVVTPVASGSAIDELERIGIELVHALRSV
jgi:hypothetical protein